MSLVDKIAESFGLSERRPIQVGLVLTVVVHVCLAMFLIFANGSTPIDSARGIPGPGRMCGDLRCPEPPFMSDRRGADSIDKMDAGVIEASVIPRLGMAKPTPGQLPRFLKYEQAEKIEEAVNINKANQEAQDLKNKEIKAKKAQVDSRRRNTDLGNILGDAPDDDDPRARPTALDRIVGDAQGSVYGTGTEAKEGSIYAGKVGEAIRAQFTVPPFLTPGQLKALRVRIKILKISAAGQILDFEVQNRSADQSFNNAAIFAIRRFSPKDGGNVFLPAPDAKTLELVNRRGMVVDLDGSLFRR